MIIKTGKTELEISDKQDEDGDIEISIASPATENDQYIFLDATNVKKVIDHFNTVFDFS